VGRSLFSTLLSTPKLANKTKPLKCTPSPQRQCWLCVWRTWRASDSRGHRACKIIAWNRRSVSCRRLSRRDAR